MGSFYDNALVTAPLDRVVANLGANGSTGLAVSVGPDWTIAYPSEPYEIDVAELSRELECSVLTASVHDSDVLWLQVWTFGGIMHEYCNYPTCFADEVRDFDGVPHGLVRFGEAAPLWMPVGPLGVVAEPFGRFALGEPDNEALRAALSNQPLDPETPTFEDGYLLANHLHRDAMAALGLPASLLTMGYSRLSRPGNPEPAQFPFVPYGGVLRPDTEAPGRF